MARSTYPIPTRETVFYIAHDGTDFTSETKCRQHNAELAIAELVEQELGGPIYKEDVSRFIVDNASVLGPWFDDLCG
jgi:hypothetical protein